MKTIIGLRGRGYSGKTTTIRILYGLLKINDYSLVSSNFKEKKSDFKAVFSKNNKLIGITSSGDTHNSVYNPLKEFSDSNCLICVCACRTKDRVFPKGTNGAISKFTNYNNHFIEKKIGNDLTTQNIVNNNDAKTILKLIEKLVDLNN